MQWTPSQAEHIVRFLQNTARTFHEYNNAQALLADLSELRKTFRTSDLPQSRKEFEARAFLFQIANDTEYLLLAKKHFSENLSDWQIQYFWNNENGMAG